VRIEVASGPMPSAALMLPDGSRTSTGIAARVVPAVPARPSARGRYRRAVVMDAVFAAAAERRAPTLVLTGRRATARYRVRAVAVP